eukprot:m51a1_g8566 hypothetical protein (398) ;mRNA; f:184324-185517
MSGSVGHLRRKHDRLLSDAQALGASNPRVARQLVRLAQRLSAEIRALSPPPCAPDAPDAPSDPSDPSDPSSDTPSGPAVTPVVAAPSGPPCGCAASAVGYAGALEAWRAAACEGEAPSGAARALSELPLPLPPLPAGPVCAACEAGAWGSAVRQAVAAALAACEALGCARWLAALAGSLAPTGPLRAAVYRGYALACCMAAAAAASAGGRPAVGAAEAARMCAWAAGEACGRWEDADEEQVRAALVACCGAHQCCRGVLPGGASAALAELAAQRGADVGNALAALLNRGTSAELLGTPGPCAALVADVVERGGLLQAADLAVVARVAVRELEDAAWGPPGVWLELLLEVAQAPEWRAADDRNAADVRRAASAALAAASADPGTASLAAEVLRLVEGL